MYPHYRMNICDICETVSLCSKRSAIHAGHEPFRFLKTTETRTKILRERKLSTTIISEKCYGFLKMLGSLSLSLLHMHAHNHLYMVAEWHSSFVLQQFMRKKKSDSQILSNSIALESGNEVNNVSGIQFTFWTLAKKLGFQPRDQKYLVPITHNIYVTQIPIMVSAKIFPLISAVPFCYCLNKLSLKLFVEPLLCSETLSKSLQMSQFQLYYSPLPQPKHDSHDAQAPESSLPPKNSTDGRLSSPTALLGNSGPTRHPYSTRTPRQKRKTIMTMNKKVPPLIPRLLPNSSLPTFPSPG